MIVCGEYINQCTLLFQFGMEQPPITVEIERAQLDDNGDVCVWIQNGGIDPIVIKSVNDDAVVTRNGGKYNIHPEGLLRIAYLFFMDVVSMGRLERSSKMWRRVIRKSNIWRSLFAQDYRLIYDQLRPNGSNPPKYVIKKLDKMSWSTEQRINDLKTTDFESLEPATLRRPYWKLLYEYHYRDDFLGITPATKELVNAKKKPNEYDLNFKMSAFGNSVLLLHQWSVGEDYYELDFDDEEDPSVFAALILFTNGEEVARVELAANDMYLATVLLTARHALVRIDDETVHMYDPTTLEFLGEGSVDMFPEEPIAIDYEDGDPHLSILTPSNHRLHIQTRFHIVDDCHVWFVRGNNIVVCRDYVRNRDIYKVTVDCEQIVSFAVVPLGLVIHERHIDNVNKLNSYKYDGVVKLMSNKV
jgi:hypothetical protein